MYRLLRPRSVFGPVLAQSRRSLLTQARAKGPLEPPLLEETVGENFARIVSAHGDRPAVISRHQQKRLTYQELDLDSNVLAKGLQSLGVRKGDRVCVQLGNNLEFATVTYALFKLGAILVPLNPAFNAAQIISAFNHLSATHLIIGTETNLPYKPPKSNVSLLQSIVPDLSSPTLTSEAIPTLKHIVLVDNSRGRVDPSSLRVTIPWASISQDSSTSAPSPDSPPLKSRNRQYPVYVWYDFCPESCLSLTQIHPQQWQPDWRSDASHLSRYHLLSATPLPLLRLHPRIHGHRYPRILPSSSPLKLSIQQPRLRPFKKRKRLVSMAFLPCSWPC